MSYTPITPKVRALAAAASVPLLFMTDLPAYATEGVVVNYLSRVAVHSEGSARTEYRGAFEVAVQLPNDYVVPGLNCSHPFIVRKADDPGSAMLISLKRGNRGGARVELQLSDDPQRTLAGRCTVTATRLIY